MLTILTLSLTLPVSSQVRAKAKANRHITSCEDGLKGFDSSLYETQSFPETSLILIAHRGTGERKDASNFRLGILERLFGVRGSKVNAVFAEGKSVVGLGKIDIYLGGKVFREIFYGRNSKTFCESP